MKQKTIQNQVSISGIGVHSGTASTVILRPAPANSGITLINPTFPEEPIKIGTIIPEHAMHATVIRQKSWAISTIEHLMAAIAGLEIDNLMIEVSGQEVPILDGSALPFVHAIKQVHIKEQEAPKQFLTPKETLEFEYEGKHIRIEPLGKEKEPLLTVNYSVDFDHPLVRDTKIEGIITPEFFMKEIAPARTFGFLEQLPMLRKHGLAKGTTLGNTVVVGTEELLNEKRFENEFVRHKLLDLLGDLSLLGKQLVGTLTAHKTGHNFNRQVVEHYLKNPSEWRNISSTVKTVGLFYKTKEFACT